MSIQNSVLSKDNIKDIYRLSPTQEGILFHTLLDPDSVVYLQQQSYRMRGRLDKILVEKAFDEVIRRHDVLRTVFKYTGTSAPLQIVLKERKTEIANYDIRSINESGLKEKELERLKEADRSHSFDLTKGPLMRVTLVRMTDDEYELIWSCHHILIDGWCLGILQSEFLEIYDSYSEHRPYLLPPPTPFSSYILWLEGQEKEEAKQFWQTYLMGYTDAVSFNDQRAPLIRDQGYLNQKIVISLSETEAAGLRNLASEHQVSVAQLLSTIWGILLAKYSGTSDVVFGLVVSGRPAALEDVEGIIGLFINTLPVRLNFDGDMAFTTLLRKVSRELLTAEQYSFFPLNEIMNLTEIKGELFDHILVFHNNSHRQVSPDNSGKRVTVTAFNIFEQTSYDLCLDIFLGQSINISFTFNANLHKPSLIERTGLIFTAMIDQVLADPAILLRRISLMTERDRDLLEQFNQTEREFPCVQSVAQIVEGFAANQPEKTAVECSGRYLRYCDLDQNANRLAHLLRDQYGVEPNDIVVILMERSEAMVVSILATWKLGAAYLPLDVDYPADYLSEVVADSRAKVVLADRNAVGDGIEEKLSSLTNLFAFSDLNGSIAEADGSALPFLFDPKGLAYVIYTSGSTGRPKGVMIEHAGMLNHLYTKIHDLKLDAKSAIAQNASHCFDISVWQFFAALMVGGRTIIYPKPTVMDPEAFVEKLDLDQLTILELVPSYLSVLLETVNIKKLEKGFKSLNYLIATGEALSASLAERWFEVFPDIPLVNAYGPTEASDDITHYFLTEPPAAGESVPIGAPLANLKIYIVDEFMNRCPIGIKGEILVSGIGVGRGYLNDQQKTQQAFLEDPFCEKKGIRMYRTGDIGRYREDGSIEFFGRKDNQVKIHGFRVELQAIENVMRLHPSIRDAVVVDKRDEGDETYLSGYIIATCDFDLEEFRGFLAIKLPRYLIPSYIWTLSEFPVTHNGKIDRKALRRMDISEEFRPSAGVLVAPRNETEEALTKIWKEVLKVNQISIKDDFFEIGGDSFKAIRVASKYGKGFLVPDLYKHPTIEGLAAFIDANRDEPESLLYLLTPSVQKAKYAVIAIPHSGGDPSAHQETANALARLSDDYACYGIVLTRPEPKEGETIYSVLDDVTDDIIREIKQKIDIPIIILGQCNGSALALQLAVRVQKENIACKFVCMSGQLPRTRRGPVEDSRGDEQIFAFLDKLGGIYPVDPEDKIMFLRNFRYDGTLARTSYNKSLEEIAKGAFKKLSVPLYCIVGDKDPLTKSYKLRYRAWKQFAEQVELAVIKDVGHYIWRDKPDELAQIIFNIVEGRFAVAEANSKTLMARLGTLFSSR
jgi:amino acid adenylation domain-containing protein